MSNINLFVSCEFLTSNIKINMAVSIINIISSIERLIACVVHCDESQPVHTLSELAANPSSTQLESASAVVGTTSCAEAL